MFTVNILTKHVQYMYFLNVYGDVSKKNYLFDHVSVLLGDITMLSEGWELFSP